MPAIDWLYRFIDNERFPDPQEAVSSLAAICHQSGTAFLLLRNGKSPPMCSARTRETIAICIGKDDRMVLEGIATVAKTPARHAQTPASMIELYGELNDRVFCQIEKFERQRSTLLDPKILPLDEQKRFCNGQRIVKRIGGVKAKPLKRVKPKQQVSAESDFHGGSFDRVTINLDIPGELDEAVLGLDPTAATWESAMTEGPKKMPSFAIKISNGKLSVVDQPLRLHRTNDEFWQRASELGCQLVCIDGPNDTNGPKLLPDYTGWDPSSPDGQRSAERELNAAGIGLFWTTRNTVMSFDGASRWIARSMRLFSESSELEKIETHPHGVFAFLWRAFGMQDAMPPKNKPAGMSARFAMLSKLLPDLKRESVPDHDAMDAAAAALAAALHRLGMTRPFGESKSGGQIWIPDITQSVKASVGQSGAGVL